MRVSPDPESPGTSVPWRGFRFVLDTLIAPRRAFAEIAACPEWLAAYAIVVASGAIALALTIPAVKHVVIASPVLLDDVGKPAAKLLADVKTFVFINAAEQVISPLFSIGLTATVLTSIARFKGKDTSFRVYVSLASNALVPTAIGSLLGGIAVAFHPVASFANFKAINVAFPDNLALFAAGNNVPETAFLAHFDIFTIWATLLLGYGFAATTPVKFETAIFVAFTITLVLALFN